MNSKVRTLHAMLLDPEVRARCSRAFHDQFITGDYAFAFSALLDDLTNKYGVEGYYHETGVILWARGSRAKHPAVLAVTLGGAVSWSALAYARCNRFVAQLFDVGADDADLAGTCPGTPHRVQHQDRVLCI